MRQLRHNDNEDFDFSYPSQGPLSGFWLVPSIILGAMLTLILIWLFF